jgi:hypothetical protein
VNNKQVHQVGSPALLCLLLHQHRRFGLPVITMVHEQRVFTVWSIQARPMHSAFVQARCGRVPSGEFGDWRGSPGWRHDEHMSLHAGVDG